MAADKNGQPKNKTVNKERRKMDRNYRNYKNKIFKQILYTRK